MPVGHICIIAKREYAGGRELGREERLRPWLGRFPGGPRLVAIAGKAVYEDDTVKEVLVVCLAEDGYAYSILAFSGS